MSENRQHTEEFYEVAQRMPGKYTTIILWGICIFVVLIFVIGFIAEVPECVYAEVKVISTNPPITLNALSSGKIHILDNRSSIKCKRGQYLAIIENSADYKDIITLKNWLLDNRAFEENNIETIQQQLLMLGEIESDYYTFKVAYLRYHQLKEGHNDYHHSLTMLDNQIEGNRNTIDNCNSMMDSYSEEAEIRSYYLKSDSMLYEKTLIPKDELDNSNLRYFETRNKILSLRQQIDQAQNNIVQNMIKKEQLIDGINNALDEARISLYNSYNRLLIQIKNWEKTYVFIAPDDCNAEFAALISEGSFVSAGEPIYNIIYENNTYFGLALLPSEGSGNVTVGDSVNLKMMLYPYQEYGCLRGHVERISMSSVDRNYLLYIGLSAGLKSDNGHVLSFAEAMYGQAEIITDKKKLIFVLFNKLRGMLNSNQKKDNATESPEKGIRTIDSNTNTLKI